MDKQFVEVKEMARVICGFACDYETCDICHNDCLNAPCEYHDYAINLIRAGYTKNPSVVRAYMDGYKQGFKEGVEAVRIQLLDCIEIKALREAGAPGAYRCITQKIDEICEELEGE